MFEISEASSEPDLPCELLNGRVHLWPIVSLTAGLQFLNFGDCYWYRLSDQCCGWKPSVELVLVPVSESEMVVPMYSMCLDHNTDLAGLEPLLQNVIEGFRFEYIDDVPYVRYGSMTAASLGYLDQLCALAARRRALNPRTSHVVLMSDLRAKFADVTERR